MFKSIGILSLVALLGIAYLGFGERIVALGVDGFVSSARAEVGRPLTPVSVAGAARRSARRN
jgi:hypothetical protein